MKTYTLKDIAALKNASVEDITAYLANERDYILTKTSDQPLSPSEIKLIDPILYFKLQHPTSNSKKDQTAESQSEEGLNSEKENLQDSENQLSQELQVEEIEKQTNALAGMKLSKAGKYFHQSWNDIAKFLLEKGMPIIVDKEYQLSDEQYDALKAEFGVPEKKLIPKQKSGEYFGVVHFYDYLVNHFGFLGTNELCPISTCHFNYKNIVGKIPSDCDLVFFKLNGQKIETVSLVNENTPINWVVALKYIGEFSDIKTTTKKGEKRNIENVLGRLIRISNGVGLWNTLVDLLENSNENHKTSLINTYLSNPTIFNFVAAQLKSTNYDTSLQGVHIWIEAVLDKYLEREQFEDFCDLRDSNPHIQLPINISDSLRYYMFKRYGDATILDGIQDIENRDLNIAKTIRALSLPYQKERLRALPQGDYEHIVMEHLKETEIYRDFIKERWDEEKSNMPYIVLDIESDGENISEFAFIYEDHTQTFNNETQLKALGRRLKKADIVVGHNIRVWDLPILEKKGITTSAFIWDTLEMEILLNPCRYAYSLHTQHNASYDAELTNKLFWNQLYRLSKDHVLCAELKDFLPQQIESIITALQKSEYSLLFKEESASEVQFFQELIKLSPRLLADLNDINNIPETNRVLIIAPKELWVRLAQYVKIGFPHHNNELRWKIVNNELINLNDKLSNFQKAFLSRFVTCSQTPLVANIAQYIRAYSETEGLTHISNELLEECTTDSISHIDCIDIESFGDQIILEQDYQHIFVIGSEMHDRTHKCQLGEPYTFSKLLSLNSKLPLFMAAANYCAINDDELKKIGLLRPSLTANVWAERTCGDTFTIYHNYEYQVYRKAFLSHFNAQTKSITWEFANTNLDRSKILLVSTEHNSEFDASLYRLSPRTTLRCNYWAYQFQLLNAIYNENSNIPIIYVVDDNDEQEARIQYATSLGYYIPQEGSTFRKLEYIQNHNKGLIFISKEEFINGIGEYRTDKQCCFVWDNMDVDRYKLMWRKLPFEHDIEDIENKQQDERNVGTTAKQCILAEWPIFEYYLSLISANNKESKLYILEPTLEEYSDISELCQCTCKTLQPWNNIEEYHKSIVDAGNYFKSHANNIDSNLDVGDGMRIIRNTFLNGNELYEYQKDVLPQILQRKQDLMISIPTGGGKSILFQGPAIYRAAHSRKLSLVITPLKALMQDQVEELHAKGFTTNVDFLSGDRLYAEIQQIYRRIASGDIALLYVTPERFRVRSFINVLQQRLEKDRGLEYVIFDEAHCISQWGQDFRPDYQNVLNKCVDLREQYPFTFTFFSATITSQIENDIRKRLPDILRVGQSAEDYNPVRNHIEIEFQSCAEDSDARFITITNFITEKRIIFDNSRMIVFCRTHKQCEEVADELNNIFLKSADAYLARCHDHVAYFHAGLDAEQRNDIYERFKSNNQDRFYILCTTKAFGMGMDIPNIHYVFHYSPPSVMEDYLQEVGRAGRNKTMYEAVFVDGSKIPAVCMVSDSDFAKLKDLLINSLMTWSDLKDAKEAAVEYISRFQEIKDAVASPVVVPYNFWTKNLDNQNLSDTTSSKLALHWLEHIGYFKQGYVGQACLDITLHKSASDSPQTYSSFYNRYNRLSTHASCVWKYLTNIITQMNVNTQVSIQQMRTKLHMSLPRLIDALIECESQEYLSVNDSMQVILRPRRMLETRYMLDNDKNIFALHIIMEGVRTLLSTCKENEERVIGAAERKSICNELLNDFNCQVIEETKTNRDGKEVKTLYMPWKHDVLTTSALRGAVTKLDTFTKNIRTSAGFRIFSILNMIPGVIHKIEKSEDEILDIICVKKDWRSFIDDFESDCLEFLKLTLNKDEEKIVWTNEIIEHQWDASNGKGFNYFSNILATLKMLSYIEYSSPIQNGVEIYTTNKTEEPWDNGEASNSANRKKREEFDEQQSLKQIRLAAMNIFSIIIAEKRSEYIRRYFQCRNYNEFMTLIGDYVPEDSDILSQLKAEALKKEEQKLENNKEQKEIYDCDKQKNINVLAGPGSGKTHMLTMRCAKLIYRESVNPRHILILAYNRAVVAELKNRLDTLFVKLGMSRVAHQLHVHTFHALAKKAMGARLDNVPTDEWEMRFNEYLSKNRSLFKALFTDIEYIMVDEFQDITQSRLNILLKLHNFYSTAKFFTIGDINQSIYGFDRVPKGFWGTPEEYAKLLSPKPYYDKWNEAIKPTQMNMFTNYRSYQKILDSAKVFLTNPNDLPTSVYSLMEHEPHEPYVLITDATQPNAKAWFNDILPLVEWARTENSSGVDYRHISTIAVFFRTNSEVYRGYSKIKSQIPSDVKIRIQGANSCELWREREVYEIIQFLKNKGNVSIVQENLQTQRELCRYIEELMIKHPNWDKEYLDIAFTIILNYLDTIRSDENYHSYNELADYICEVASKDDAGHVYKIYDHYKEERLIKEDSITIVLTTIHKVKGLEFDVVMVTPSYANLPLKMRRDYAEGGELMADDIADIDEERRLLYVAYTRAKKYLHIYKWKREFAIEEYKTFTIGDDTKLGYSEKDAGIDKYYLSYTAQEGVFAIDNYIRENVKKDDPVMLVADRYENYHIYHSGKDIGRLSFNSDIVKKAKKDGIVQLSGFFVSDVFVWTYQETEDSDRNNGKEFAKRWCTKARKQGYVTVVQIAGFGNKIK